MNELNDLTWTDEEEIVSGGVTPYNQFENAMDCGGGATGSNGGIEVVILFRPYC